MAAIFICRGCGMSPYFSTYPSRHRQLMADEYYQLGLYSFERGFKRQHGILAASLAEVARIKPLNGARLLDVGCGEGYLLEMATALRAWVKGIEPNRRQAIATKEKGYDVFHGFLEDYASIAGETWDIIALAWVLDAMGDPVRCLKIARQLLAADGILVILLGSTFGGAFFSRPSAGIGGVWPLLKQKPLATFKPDKTMVDSHPVHFTRKTLLAALAIAGFEAISVDADRGTRVIAKPAPPKPLGEIETEDPDRLRRYFVRWKAHDVFVRPLYARFIGSFWPRLPLHLIQYVRRHVYR